MQALDEKKQKSMEALARKQKRNAAMQAMLAKPGYQGALLESAIDVTPDVPAWVLDGGTRCSPSPLQMP